MSACPIKQWRDGFKKPLPTSTTQAVHAQGNIVGYSGWYGYCGRQTKAIVLDWDKVTCADCIAAHSADERLAGDAS